MHVVGRVCDEDRQRARRVAERIAQLRKLRFGAAGNVDFFRRMPKRIVESSVGAIRAPNFYYRSGSVQLLFVAPFAVLSARYPIVSPRNHR
ncbi:hypothetical protein [Burkholderia multivorans]|uniref:hypothetical protein n=1 Tax=Burkholderia multivorans TaxID=87883 RepID=UPI003BF59064